MGKEIKIKGLFEKFGEFDSAEEINRAVQAQLAQGDIEAVKMIAKENGIDEMDVQDFIDDTMPELCSPFSAAIGKLDVEAEALKLPMTMQSWKSYISGMLADDDGDKLMRGIRRKGKSLAELFGKILVECSRSRMNTPQPIVDYARQIDRTLPGTIPTADLSRKRFEEIVKEYYIDKNEEVAPVQQEETPEETPEAAVEDEEGDDE